MTLFLMAILSGNPRPYPIGLDYCALIGIMPSILCALLVLLVSVFHECKFGVEWPVVSCIHVPVYLLPPSPLSAVSGRHSGLAFRLQR